MVGDRLAPRLIDELGDINRFHNGSTLSAYAGIDKNRFSFLSRHIMVYY